MSALPAIAAALLLAAAVLVAGLGDPPAVPRRGPRAPARRPPRRRRGTPDAATGPDPALLLELTAVAIGAGLPPGRALEQAVRAGQEAAGWDLPADLARACAQLGAGAGPERAWEGVEERWWPLAEPLLLSARTGASAAALLVSAAAGCRAERARAAAEAAARLGSLLVLPLGLCTLPSFLLLGVVPVVLSLAGDVLTG
ncbi:type II secretion system F family protein [Kineococcus gypseus]|uniref:type II secretion system F family protein n=1 Tax=Kineococcus gypseus TaxID=1637102 RepID=UPI003D7D1D19